MSFNVEQVDVTVCGGGPIGLLTAYGLLRAGVSSCIVEKDIKSDMPEYGRACSIFPRSLEYLESYDLLHDMVQEGFIDRSTFTRTGIDDGYVSDNHLRKSQMSGSYLDFVLNLRQKHVESFIQRAYERAGGIVAVGWQLTDIAVDPAQELHQVVSRLKNVRTGDFKIVRSKYLVGADGFRSTVRAFAGIRMPWSNTVSNWVRVDGVIETDFEAAQLGSAFFQSPSHGVVQIYRLDRGRTRIGYRFSLDLARKYGQYMTQEQAVDESRKAMLPWKCEFRGVDWYTCYSVRNGVADVFLNGPIILVGDAAHVHSSGAAQGLNAGIHDAANLAWKLAGVVKGYYDPVVLETYDTERRSIVTNMINLDRYLSEPASFVPMDEYGMPQVDISQAAARASYEATQLNIGLEVCYPENSLNRQPTATTLIAGCRSPDGLLYSPGSKIPLRVQQIIRDKGDFSMLVFAGEPFHTKQNILAFRQYLDYNSRSVTKIYPAVFKLLTVLTGNRSEGEVDLGCPRFGHMWYDHDSSVHYAYGVAPNIGAVVVVRPDGVVSFATALERGEELSDYFGSFMKLDIT